MTNSGGFWGAEGRLGVKHRCCVLTACDATAQVPERRKGRGRGHEGLRALHCACVSSQVHISVILLGNVRIHVVARENLENCSFALVLLNGIAVHCSECFTDWTNHEVTACIMQLMAL